MRQCIWATAFLSPLVFTATYLVLGMVTPDYDPVNYTISRLALTENGWIYSVSLGVLAAGLFLGGVIFRNVLKGKSGGRLWMSAFSIASVLVVLLIIFPTDPIENVRFSLGILTPSGMVHMGSVMAFILLSFPGVRLLAKALEDEKGLSLLAGFTEIMGYVVLTLSVLWLITYVAGIFLQYRGLFQKVIAVLTVFWLSVMFIAARKPYLRNHKH